jgi:RNA polymerase sigma-70 factor (ECF subfamily)
MTPSSGDITVILQRWDTDRQAAIEAITPIVYDELRKIAAAYMRKQRPGHTLQPTALINEAFLRLVKQENANLRDRSHFYALAARMMRQILVDTARAYRAAKRGKDHNIPIDEKIQIAGNDRVLDFFAVHEALEKLHARNARAAQVIELRYFGGLQLEEIAETLAIGLATVKRDLALGHAWLGRALAGA